MEDKQFQCNIRIKPKRTNQTFAQEVKLLKNKLQEKISSTSSSSSSYLDYLISARNDRKEFYSIEKKQGHKRNARSNLDVLKETRIRLSPLYNPEAGTLTSIPTTIETQNHFENSSFQKKKRYLSHSQNKVCERYEEDEKIERKFISSFLQPSFDKLFESLKVGREKRTKDDLEAALNHLRQHNRVFIKLDPNLSLCLLRIGNFKELQPGEILYSLGATKQVYYIILDGIFSLTNTSIGMKKLCSTGETLGEEILLQNSNKMMFETAKAVVKSYVLEIKIGEYTMIEQEVKEEMCAKALKRLKYFLEESLNSKRIERNKCDVELNKRFATIT